MKSVEFYFDFGSPTSFIAYKVLPRVALAAGAEIIWRPMLLGGVFKATGNMSPVMVAVKGRYMGPDLAEFCRKYGVSYTFNNHFPVNTLALMRGAVGLLGGDGFERYVDAMYEAMWVTNQNLNQPEVIGEVLTKAGFDAQEFLSLINDQAVKDKLIAATEEAVERGVFGAPTMFVGERMFFGQDRLHFVAEALGVNFLDVVPDFIEG